MSDRQDSWYRRRLALRFAIYALGGIAAALSALLYSSATLRSDFLLRAVIVAPFLLSVFEEQELRWGNRFWGSARLPLVASGLLLGAYFFLSDPTLLATAIAVVLVPYFGFACFTALRSMQNIQGFRAMFDLRESVRKNRSAAKK